MKIEKWRGFENVWKMRKVAAEAKMGMYNVIVIPNILFCSEYVRDKCRVEN